MAEHPLVGTAPRMPQGLAPAHVATVICDWVFGDQFDRGREPLRVARRGGVPCAARRERGAASQRWHRQRLHLVLSAMTHFAAELRAEGYEVDHRHTGTGPSAACRRVRLGHVHDHGYAHHIERLMVLGNLALTAGVDPGAMTAWMRESFVDGAEWVMSPNVIGMALFADGGMMATKPYASGGSYIDNMSDSCRSCRFDPKQRVGPDACPYTTLYWDFLARNAETLAANHRMARPLAAMRRLSDLPPSAGAPPRS